MTPDPKTVNEAGRSPVRWLTDPFAAMGRKAINWVNNLGASTIFVSLAVLKIFRPKQLMKVLEQLWLIGAGSVPIIILVGLFTGMVLGLQSYHALVKFGSQGALGTLVALSLIREPHLAKATDGRSLAPILPIHLLVTKK